MSDCIEREAAIKAVCDCMPHTCSLDDCSHGCQGVAALDSVPAADVRPVVRGKWISHDFVAMGEGRYTGSVECSACGRFLPLPENFCPNCGAMMEDHKDGTRPSWCPLVHVLGHGRLGDLDELKDRATKHLYASNHGSMAEAYFAALIDLIDTAPTIIPAEEGE